MCQLFFWLFMNDKFTFTFDFPCAFLPYKEDELCSNELDFARQFSSFWVWIVQCIWCWTGIKLYGKSLNSFFLIWFLILHWSIVLWMYNTSITNKIEFLYLNFIETDDGWEPSIPWLLDSLLCIGVIYFIASQFEAWVQFILLVYPWGPLPQC